MSNRTQFRASVLIIDDNRTDATILEARLKALGCFVDVSDDIGFSEKMDNPYNIIFVDIEMPITDGYSLASMIRESSLAIKDVPIIAVSGRRYSREQAQNSLESGLDGYVEKPVGEDVLIEILLEYLPDQEVHTHKFSNEGSIRAKGFIRKRKQA